MSVEVLRDRAAISGTNAQRLRAHGVDEAGESRRKRGGDLATMVLMGLSINYN